MTPSGMKRLMLDEGLRLKVYNDATGHTLDYQDIGGNPTIGYGRDLITQGLSLDEARFLLANDLAAIDADLGRRYAFMNAMPPTWADVMVMIEYNTGRLVAWKKLLAAFQAGDVQEAAAQILNSVVYRGAGHDRYARFRQAILTRQWDFTPAEEVSYADML